MVKVVASNDTPSNVKLVGDAKGLVYISDEKNFLSAVGMMPGDKVSRSMTIENNYESSYELFVRAEKVTPKDEYDLLGKMNLKITNGKVEYNGPILIGEDKPIELDLGLFNPGDKRVFNAQVELDGTITGNDYMNREVEVNWIFTAENRSVNYDPIKTQDNNNILLSCLLAGGSLLVIILVSKKFKDGKEE